MLNEVLELPDKISRREFLHMSGLGLLSLAVPVHWRKPSLAAEAGQLGRIADPTVSVFGEPSFLGEIRKLLWRDDVVEIAAAVLGDRVPEHNRIWYEVDGLGFIHSSGVQPVKRALNEPLVYVPMSGTLMEVTVPFVDAYWKPRTNAEAAYRFYYGTTHWITGVSRDVKLRKWYRIQDDKYTYVYYAPAESFRPIPISELIPISAEVPFEEKRIVVDLSSQWVHCYEGSQRVFTSKVSTGRKFEGDWYWTPEGDFLTFRKRASRHMSNGNRASGYDLPGVPWVSYITEDGVAFHGTYWHNDFGAPRSHGCINMTSDAAKWLFRWTHPIVPGSEQEVWVSYGTTVNIRV